MFQIKSHCDLVAWGFGGQENKRAVVVSDVVWHEFMSRPPVSHSLGQVISLVLMNGS